MHRTRLLAIGLLLTVLAVTALLAGCNLAPTDTGTDGAAPSNPNSFWIMIGFIVILFALMYFFTIRPQRKRQQDQAKLIHQLQKGDRVITIGGLYGTVESSSEDSVVIRVESGTTMRFIKSAIATRVTEQPRTGS
ncbi:MAG: preprotein translocase subunit YajC [Dehalococcoidia bacterium]|nr:preprotein translocase subunit YajC [Dehalococcoidia bacterium]